MTEDPNAMLVRAAARLKGSKALSDAAQAAWDRICTAIEKRALAARPRPKVFEVHHETQVCRAAFLTVIADGGTIEQAETAGFERTQLPRER